MNNATFYLTVSSKLHGALGIFHVHGNEADLAANLDVRIRSGECNALKLGELRYGWLRDDSGDVVDEVMLARPSSGMRVLMTHGGTAVRGSVVGYLERAGFGNGEENALASISVLGTSESDAMYERLLASCVTEAQAAAILEARRDGRAVSADILAVRRVVLAGAPNAGKSSLLNWLSGYDRAFVHAEAGATRDVVDELVDLGGYAVWLGDLPGFSGDGDGVAGEAWRMASLRLSAADCVLFVLDGARGWEKDVEDAAAEVARALREGAPVVVILNKSDLPGLIEGEPWLRYFPGAEAVRVCSLANGNARKAVAEAVTRYL